MKFKGAIRLTCIVLIATLLCLWPTTAHATEQEGRFVLVAESGGQLVIAPEYISYSEGQNIGQALENSGHTFTGLDLGQVTAIDDVTGNYTRSDQNGGYDLSVQASSVTHYRFSENISGSQPSEGLLLLMTVMAEYLEKPEDVRNAAKEAYDTAIRQFVGCTSDDARMLANELEQSIRSYEATLTGEQHTVTFTDGNQTYSATNFPGVTLTAENPYGKVWEDDGDGKLTLPVGTYDFCVTQDGLRVEGTIAITTTADIAVKLPKEPWLKLDTFRLSGSYGADSNEEHKFTDDEFTLSQWTGRTTTVSVLDMFHGAVYVYAEYDTTLLSETPDLSAIYTMANSEERMEKKLAFESMNSGAYEVLAKGAEENTVIYRVVHHSEDGYTYSQDYTVVFGRIPTLTAITVVDQDGTDQAPTERFSGTVPAYTYKVLDSVQTVTISAQPLVEAYTITVNGQPMESGVTLPVSGETTAEVVVSYGAYSNAYQLTIQPGEGKTLSFLSDKSVTIEVVNSNGVVMPYTTHRETSTQNRYKYTLVPGETYRYIATKDTYYHIADEFRLEDVANSTITVDFAQMQDWLVDLALGTGKSNKQKNTILLDADFSASNHSYQAVYPDTEHNAYLWVESSEDDVEIQAIYQQLFSSEIYHGKEYRLDLTSGKSTGEKLNRFLMDENPVENILTIRLTKEENGVTYYQDYLVELKRSLSVKDLSSKCDGATAMLMQSDGTTGFLPEVLEYEITVSLAAQALELNFACYEENLCFGEEQVGYRVLVDGVEVTQYGSAVIELDGSFETQTILVTVMNEKAPEGTAVYQLHILKSPPVTATFAISPGQAQLSLYEILSGERLWPDANGDYLLCEGYSYRYTLTQHDFVGAAGQLDVTRNEQYELVVSNGNEQYPVQETESGGAVTINWALESAPVNDAIQISLPAAWPNFRGGTSNNAVTDAQIPTSAEDGTLYWANKLGSGIDSDAVGSPILVGGDLITYASDKIYRIDTVTGQILAMGTMDHKSSFSITPPAYAEGMVFVALSNGCVQAFNAVTLESLWIYNDPLGGQPNCPLTVKNGYLYTGFWNSETGNANFVCLTITDEDPAQDKEEKCNSWYHTTPGGYYWAGAYAGEDYVLVGTDDGTNRCNSNMSSLLLFDAKTGKILDRWDYLNGDIRSTVVYDDATDAFYFTSKGGSFYSLQITEDRKMANMWSIDLQNGTGGIPMSTCSPVVYQGRAYVGVSGSGQFSAYSGHNITVLDLTTRRIAYRVETQGYPQTSGLLTTAYDAQSGYAYVYFFDNMTPGKLRVLRDKPGMTAADYITTEGGQATAYALFTPTGEQAQYAICSPIVDEYGTIYFKNDSAHLMAFGSMIEKLEITTMPNKTQYAAGETFDPTGMVITATYQNGKTRDVSQYVTYPTEPLTEADVSVTIIFPYVMYHNQENGTEMTAGLVSTTPVVTLSLKMTSFVLGDVNDDGMVNQQDAQMILDYEAQNLQSELNLQAADVSGDGIIDSNDAVLILQFAAGQITSFPGK